MHELLASGILPPINTLYYSTMTRATETGELILSQLPATTPRQSCPLIQEGAVARPNPPAGELHYMSFQFQFNGRMLF